MGTNKIKTFKNVVDTLLCICRDHPQVNMAVTSDPWEVNTAGKLVYPACVVVPTSMEALDKQVKYNFNLICMDLVEPGETNEQNVLSSTSGILLDIVAWLKRGGRGLLNYPSTNSHYDYTNEVSETFTLEPFTEKFDDNVAGWNMQFSITMVFDYSVCHWDGSFTNIQAIADNAEVTAQSIQGEADCDDG